MWNFSQNTKLSIHENVFETIVCEMAAILSRSYSYICTYGGMRIPQFQEVTTL